MAAYREVTMKRNRRGLALALTGNPLVRAEFV